ncbi:glycosyltransferase family 2 protein [Glaciecola sp. 1036]|uniref:glycosyltransferase family 2 protein n=1 Tax=Alteromonadaceae TaxID=72275 RepID=UPI003D019DB2
MIGAVIVLYNPELSETCKLVETIQRQVDGLVIVDNSKENHESAFDLSKASYLHYADNIGVACAHNRGLSKLLQDGFTFAVLLDQDSTIPEDFVFRISSLLIASEKQKIPLVAIGPRVVCSFTNKQLRPKLQREVYSLDELLVVTQIISSGMMIRLDKLEIIGMKDESLFIDGVDHEWCWRAKQHGYNVGIAERVLMQHKLGDARKKFVGITYKVGSPVRLYYQFRNILLLCRRDYVPLYWKLRNLGFMPLRFFINVFFEDQKIKRFKFMVKGVFDGVLNNSSSKKE